MPPEDANPAADMAEQIKEAPRTAWCTNITPRRYRFVSVKTRPLQVRGDPTACETKPIVILREGTRRKRFHFNPFQRGQHPHSLELPALPGVPRCDTAAPLSVPNPLPVLRPANPGIRFIRRTQGFGIKLQLDPFSNLAFCSTRP